MKSDLSPWTRRKASETRPDAALRLSLALLMFTLAASSGSADTVFDQRYSAAKEAFEQCQSAWRQSTREKAVNEIADSGTSMVLMLDPLNETQGLKLDEVSAMLRECTSITYQK